MWCGEYTKGADYEFNCYNAVVFWAFQGAISRRWLFNYWEGKDGNHAFPIFSRCGWLTDIEYQFGKSPTLVKDSFNGGRCMIPWGLAVYFVTPHIIISANGAFDRFLGSAADSPINRTKYEEVATLVALYKF